jgi:hypothetical protein
MSFVKDGSRRNWSPRFRRWFTVKNNPTHRDKKTMEESQDKSERARGRSDEELRHALARAVRDAEKVIGAGTPLLPFESDADEDGAVDEVESVPEAETGFVM